MSTLLCLWHIADFKGGLTFEISWILELGNIFKWATQKTLAILIFYDFKYCENIIIMFELSCS